MKKDGCIFCMIANGEIPSTTLYEDEKFRVFMDLSPATEGHCLVVPREHYANLYEMPDDLAAEAMRVAKKMSITLKERLQADGINLVQNNGEAAGQTVGHFHIHLIPRYREDGQKIGWVPRETDLDKLHQLSEKILNK